MQTMEQQLISACAAFDHAFNQQQVSVIRDLYAEDAVVMPAPAGAVVTGQQAIADFFAGLIQAGVINHALRIDRSVLTDTLAVCSGQWSAAMVADGQTQTFAGNVQLVLRQQHAGHWLVISHIWN